MGELPVGERGIARAVRHAEHGNGRRCVCRRQYRRHGAAVGVRVGAAAIGASWIVRVIVIAVSDGSDIVPVIVGEGSVHLFVGEGVCVGELRGMQDRHLAAAEHGNGKQRCDHDAF